MMTRNRRRRCSAAALVSLLVAVPGATAAQSLRDSPIRRQIVERVVAVVNDEAILLSQVRRRSLPFLSQLSNESSELARASRITQLRREILNALIDEELVRQAAADQQIRVDPAEVERAIVNVQQQSRLSEANFWEAVRNQGFTELQYREDVRRQLVRLKLLNNRVRGRINVTDGEVRSRYERMAEGAKARTCYEVSLINLPLPPEASQRQIDQARTKATQLRSELTPDTFEAQGATDLGRICRGELNPQLEAALDQTEVGGISEPLQGPAGFVILHLRDQAETSGLPPYQEVQDQIRRRLVEEAMAQQERLFLNQLRRQASIDQRL